MPLPKSRATESNLVVSILLSPVAVAGECSCRRPGLSGAASIATGGGFGSCHAGDTQRVNCGTGRCTCLNGADGRNKRDGEGVSAGDHSSIVRRPVSSSQ